MKIIIYNITLHQEDTQTSINSFLPSKLERNHPFLDLLERTFEVIPYIYESHSNNEKNNHRFHNLFINENYIKELFSKNENISSILHTKIKEDKQWLHENIIRTIYQFDSKSVKSADKNDFIGYSSLKKERLNSLFRRLNTSISTNDSDSDTTTPTTSNIIFNYYVYYDPKIDSSINYYLHINVPNKEYMKNYMVNTLGMLNEVVDELLEFKPDRFKYVKAIISED